jgi:hypothetical protein
MRRQLVQRANSRLLLFLLNKRYQIRYQCSKTLKYIYVYFFSFPYYKLYWRKIIVVYEPYSFDGTGAVMQCDLHIETNQYKECHIKYR